MKFSGREDINAPIDEVFRHLTNYEGHEELARSRGIVARRIDGLEAVGPGSTWAIDVKFRGKNRHINLEIQEVIADKQVSFMLDGSGLTGEVRNELVALAKSRTRLIVGIDVRPKNLTGRLLMQSLRILKGNLDRRFQSRLSDYVKAFSG